MPARQCLQQCWRKLRSARVLARACRQRQRRIVKGQTDKADSVLPVSADFPLTALGVTSEAFQASLHQYVRTNPDMALDASTALSRKVRSHHHCSNIKMADHAMQM